MRIFVSYHSPDRAIAERLATTLRAQGDGIEVFLDIWTLQPGAFWLPELAKELERADAMVLLLGKNSPGNWQTLEFYAAFDRKAKQPDFPVVPVVLTDPAPRLPFLGQLHWLRFDDPAAEPALAKLLPALRGGELSQVEEPWKTVNPYRGLEALGEADADFFFGRETCTADILGQIRQGRRCLLLIGNSGVGKSSLMQAGVVAALRRQRWPGAPGSPWPPDLQNSRAWLFLTLKPGDRPLYELAFAFVRLWLDLERAECGERCAEWEASFLAGRQGLHSLLRAAREKAAEQHQGTPPDRFVLVVDQAEELYTRAPANQARRFSALLAEALEQRDVLILASLRADFYGHLQADKALFSAAHRVDVWPLSQDELRAVIRCPAELLQVNFPDSADAPMVPRLAAEAAAAPGALPLLSFLLDAMWQRMQARGDGVLSWTDYAALGGVAGAVLRQATAYFETCSKERQQTLRRLFTLHLTNVPTEGEVVRRRARRNECNAEEWAIIEELTSPKWRLLIIGEEASQPTAEMAHEVLLRVLQQDQDGWKLLKDWLSEQRDFLRWKSQLEYNRKTWEKGEYQNGDLLRELPLDRALDWLAQQSENLAENDRAFIRASLALREYEQATRERDRAARKRLQRRIFSGTVSAAGVLAALLILVVIWWSEAKSQHNNMLRMQSLFLASQSQQETANGHAAMGIGLALEALPRDMVTPDRPYVAQAESALYMAISAAQERWIWILHGHTGAVQSAAFSPGGQRVITASDDGTARLWDAATGQERAILRGHGGSWVSSAAFSPDGQRVITASWDQTAQLWHVESQKSLAVLRGHTGPVMSARFSPDGQRVITASDDGTARLWDTATGQERAVLRGHESSVRSAAFSPDGQRVITASDDKRARLWDIKSSEPCAVLRGHESSVHSAAFSPNGYHAITASEDGTTRLWRVFPSTKEAIGYAKVVVANSMTR